MPDFRTLWGRLLFRENATTADANLLAAWLDGRLDETTAAEVECRLSKDKAFLNEVLLARGQEESGDAPMAAYLRARSLVGAPAWRAGLWVPAAGMAAAVLLGVALGHHLGWQEGRVEGAVEGYEAGISSGYGMGVELGYVTGYDSALDSISDDEV